MAKTKLSFHKIRQFRMSDENYELLLELKKKNKGTWNFLFTKINQMTKNQRGVLVESLETQILIAQEWNSLNSLGNFTSEKSGKSLENSTQWELGGSPQSKDKK